MPDNAWHALLYDLEEDGKEVMWLRRMARTVQFNLVVGVYYPPGQYADAEKRNAGISHWRDRLSVVWLPVNSHQQPSGLVITGNFNQMKLNQLQLCRYFSLRKVVKAPTRGRNTLDQILTNMPDLYDDVQHLPPLGRSDHQCLLLHPTVGDRKSSPPRGECV